MFVAARLGGLTRILSLVGAAACATTCSNPTLPEETAGPEVLQLTLSASATDLHRGDELVVRMYAANPGALPSVARVDCIHWGLGLVLHSPSGASQDLLTHIPPCKIPNLPPTLRIAAGVTDSAFAGWVPFWPQAAGFDSPGDYGLQVVYRTLDGVIQGQTITIRFLAP